MMFSSPSFFLSSTGSSTPYFDAVTEDAPLAYFRHLETSGTTIVNSGSIGAAIDGTSSGSPTLAQTSLIQDVGDTSILFDGTNDYYLTPTNATLGTTTTTNSVIECWLNFTTSTGLRVPVALREGTAGGSTTEHLVIIINNTGTGKITVSSGGTAINSPSAYNDSSPHYVVAEKLGTTINLYVDNSLVATGTAGTLSGTNPLKLSVGNNYTTAPVAGQYFPGYIDEVTVYRTLSTARRTAHYNAGI